MMYENIEMNSKHINIVAMTPKILRSQGLILLYSLV